MPLPLIPIAIAGLAGISWHLSRRRRKIQGMTPERQIVFSHAIKTVKDPAKLRTLAKEFRGAGLDLQAQLLEKRAALRDLPEEVKEARRAIYKKMMSSTDPTAINKIADAFAAQGATGAATSLRDYARGLVPGSVVQQATDNVELAVKEHAAELDVEPKPEVLPAEPNTKNSPASIEPKAEQPTIDVTSTAVVTEGTRAP